MRNRVILVAHDDSPRDDRASAHLAAHGFRVEWRRPFAGEALGAPDETIAGTVIYGGAQGVPEQDKYPYLADEARWAEACLRAEVPVLGICLGGQILAHTLGAHVGPHPEGLHEFGYYTVYPTDDGRLLIPEGIRFAQAHFHGFDVPAGATLLATGDLYPNQAFRYGENAFGLQFHPECTLTGFRRWQAGDWAPWGTLGAQTRDEQDALCEAADAAQHAWMVAFLDALFGQPERVGPASRSPLAGSGPG